MERRVFVAILLAAIVMYGWQALFMPPPPQPGAGPETAAPVAPDATPDAPPAPVEVPSAQPPSPGPEALVSEASERQITVETATVEAVFTNRGGRLLHWRLKDYRDASGQDVDLVPSGVPEDQPKPFSLQVEDAQVTQRLNSALYRASGDAGGRVDAAAADAALVFEYQDASGLRARKEFRFNPQNYIVTFSADVASGDQPLNPAIAWGPGLDDLGATSGGGSFFTGNYVQPPQAIYHRDGEVERLPVSDLVEEPVHDGQFRFVGVDDHYFVATAIAPGAARVEYRPLTLPGSESTQRTFVSPTFQFAQRPDSVRFFVGPKQFDLLRAADAELVRTINYGMFAWLVVPLLNTLKWLYGFTGNYGWSIVILTVLISLAMFPLRHKSVVAMRKMQAIQPEMKAIQDRYKNLKVTDPARQKMNTEVMNLYRERGVNPASGCVPMLLTMPVLLAFYSLLSMSIELRGAPFGWWIQDLSERDPYYVIPALMGITNFWQIKISPTTADPAQQRVMLIMPVMFTVMLAFAPSGVVLYWFVSNLWAIGQQYFTNWLIGPPALATVPPRPPAERRLKSAGGGRSAGADKK
jgi:YidC/Oxa1 family membrane protein insertase